MPLETRLPTGTERRFVADNKRNKRSEIVQIVRALEPGSTIVVQHPQTRCPNNKNLYSTRCGATGTVRKDAQRHGRRLSMTHTNGGSEIIVRRIE